MSNDWLTIVGIQMSDNGTDREKIAALKTSLNDITEKVVCTMYIAQYVQYTLYIKYTVYMHLTLSIII